jgi:hypothetical protein
MASPVIPTSSASTSPKPSPRRAPSLRFAIMRLSPQRKNAGGTMP